MDCNSAKTICYQLWICIVSDHLYKQSSADFRAMGSICEEERVSNLVVITDWQLALF
jgi:hypothetical protein